jgi:hypothetical protein
MELGRQFRVDTISTLAALVIILAEVFRIVFIVVTPLLVAVLPNTFTMHTELSWLVTIIGFTDTQQQLVVECTTQQDQPMHTLVVDGMCAL